jgi:hypothetical protein
MLKTFDYKLLIGLILGISFSILPYELKLVIFFNLILILLSLILIKILTFHEKLLTSLNILEINHDFNMRCLKISMINNNFLEGENLFKGIYQTLMSYKEFIDFGFQKIIILSAVLVSNKEYNLHSNILIDNNTSFLRRRLLFICI